MPYDLSKAFEAIEDELIGGIIRNLGNHKAEENQLGFEWEQWQALQIKALEDYRRKNLKKFPPRYNKLNNQIRNLLLSKYNDGQTTQERQIMQAIRRGFKSPKVPPKFTGNAKIEGDFFTVNDRKLDALIQSVTHDMERAEYAVLRLADDQYRKIIFNAQVYANTGAGTYEKAVDMAARDFLRAGVNSIEYKNGSRHTITDYADMAIKTASKRAYLQGEGKMRGEWEIYTVILNKRACPCPLCAPFVGKVFIDDVWSGGQAVAGTDYGISPVTGIKYPLLSSAIRQGLYHPRCRDVHTTYFEGISTPPEDSEYTADELDALAEKYNAEQKQAYCERQEKRYDRISKYSLAPDNQRMYGARAKEWGQKAGEYEQAVKSFGTVEKSGESGIIQSGALTQRNDPDFKRREAFAKLYYRELLGRNRKNEIAAVARNTGFTEDDVDLIFSHVFELEHLFEDGSIHKFDPDYDMAQSWFRLREGKTIYEHDMIMLYHELEEAKIMGKTTEVAYDPVHRQVEKKYNYALALKKFLKENDLI